MADCARPNAPTLASDIAGGDALFDGTELFKSCHGDCDVLVEAVYFAAWQADALQVLIHHAQPVEEPCHLQPTGVRGHHQTSLLPEASDEADCVARAAPTFTVEVCDDGHEQRVVERTQAESLRRRVVIVVEHWHHLRATLLLIGHHPRERGRVDG